MELQNFMKQEKEKLSLTIISSSNINSYYVNKNYKGIYFSNSYYVNKNYNFKEFIFQLNA